MAFHIFKREQGKRTDILHLTDESFSLAGYNLLYRAWVTRGKPIGQGWRVSAEELVEILTGGEESYATRRMIIDLHPSNMNHVILVELQEIFLFNWAGQIPGSVSWTPMMLRLREVRDDWPDNPMSAEQRQGCLIKLEIDAYGAEFVEFLYLQGDDGGWNWGRNGSTNAAFLHGQAREYFQKFF